MKPTLTATLDDVSVLHRLAHVPHRAYFGAGVVSILSLAVWWLAMMLQPASSAYPAAMVHALMMPLGVFPLFMLGFLFTAGPRWLNVPAPAKNLPLALGYLTGTFLALAGFAKGGSWPVPGLMLMQVVWTAATLRWLNCLYQSKHPDRQHALRLCIAMSVGAAALAVAILWAQSGDARLWVIARQLVLWGLLLPVFLTVSHRMLPFFTQAVFPTIGVWRPYALLDGWLVGCGLLVVASVLNLPQVEAVIAAALAASLAYTSWRWGLRASFGNRLLAMLHMSFAWLAPALLLQAMAALGLASSAAPAHALGLGFCCTMLVGFVTRVTLGHGGRQLTADNSYWAIYLGLHSVAALRVIAALADLHAGWLHLASALWLVLMVAWASKVLPIYWQARADGKPG